MAERQTKSEKQEKQRPLARRGGGGGLVPFEDVDRWFDDAFRDFFSRRWLSPWFERGSSELHTPFEGRMPKVDIVDREMSRGEFQRTVSLPVEVKGEEAKASFKDGILELVFPKMKQTKHRTIKIA